MGDNAYALSSAGLRKHRNNLNVVGSYTFEQVDPIEFDAGSQGMRAEDIYNIINGIKKAYGYVVIDVGSSLSENSVTMMDAADRILLVTTPDLVALHDASEGMGRLKLLPGSHKHGVRKVFEAEGVGGVQCEIYPGEDVWHVSDVEQGDVIIFDSCCVHKAEPNTSEDAVRISIDTRFCDYGAPVFISNLEPHHGWRIDGFDWQSIYRGWQDPALQYYWRDYPKLFSTPIAAAQQAGQ